MAYAATASVLKEVRINGVDYTTYLLVETDVGTTDQWSFQVPSIGTITLYEADLTDADAATTLDPQTTTEDGVYDGLGALTENDTPTSPIYIDTDARYVAADATLYGRSRPDAHADTITTRVTIAKGHR